jgi:histidine ammonia-lyase
MGMIAARHAREVVQNAEQVVAMEALAAAQALDIRERMTGEPPATGTAAARRAVRGVVETLDEDRPLKADVDAAIELVESGALVAAVEEVVGPLA